MPPWAPAAVSYSPVRAAPGATSVPINTWVVDRGRRDAPGGGVNGQAGDRWPGPPFLARHDEPYTRMLPPPVYQLRMNGSPLQTPKQPYRKGAGVFINSNTAMYPQPVAYGGLSKFVHQYGGSMTGGVQTQDAVRHAMAALLSVRRSRELDPPPDVDTTEVGDLGTPNPPPPAGGGFGAWFQQHQRAVLIIGGVTLLLTVYLIFRKTPAATSSAQGQTGVPTVSTSDTASAINQQNTLLEALANAVQRLINNQQAPGAGLPPPQFLGPPVPNPSPVTGGGPVGGAGAGLGAITAWIRDTFSPSQQAVILSAYQQETPQQQAAFQTMSFEEQQNVINNLLKGVSGSASTGSTASGWTPLLPTTQATIHTLSAGATPQVVKPWGTP